MGRYIARQPNGRLCRFSTVVDCVTVYNMTEEDYIELCAEEAREEARFNLGREHFVKPFERVLQDTNGNNITQDEWENILREMGHTGEAPKLEDEK